MTECNSQLNKMYDLTNLAVINLRSTLYTVYVYLADRLRRGWYKTRHTARNRVQVIFSSSEIHFSLYIKPKACMTCLTFCILPWESIHIVVGWSHAPRGPTERYWFAGTSESMEQYWSVCTFRVHGTLLVRGYWLLLIVVSRSEFSFLSWPVNHRTIISVIFYLMFDLSYLYLAYLLDLPYYYYYYYYAFWTLTNSWDMPPLYNIWLLNIETC